MFSIVIPLYNEAQNINELLREIKQQNFPYKNFEIILVDDCSIDDTIKVIKENNDLSNIQIIKNNENRGQSYSIVKGIKKSSYDIIVTIDGDGQNNPKDILKLLKIYLSDKEIKLVTPMVYFIATNHDIFKEYSFPKNSVVIDPWRIIPEDKNINLISVGKS